MIGPSKRCAPHGWQCHCLGDTYHIGRVLYELPAFAVSPRQPGLYHIFLVISVNVQNLLLFPMLLVMIKDDRLSHAIAVQALGNGVTMPHYLGCHIG